jgi:peptidoglycan/xylan/chitin deacetylase (PgdA/CDA1 family)
MTFLQGPWSKRRAFAGAVMYWSGFAWALECITRPTGAIVLMYHSVADKSAVGFIDPPNHLDAAHFERQMEYLSKYRHVISLGELVQHLTAGKALPAGSVCITFDDGYLDNLTVAAPILAKYSLPATLYLPTAYIDRAETHWADVLHQSFTFRTKNVLTIPALGLRADISKAGECVAAYRSLHGPLLVSLYDERQALLAEVQRQLEPKVKPPRLTMNWDDVRRLQKDYPLFSIGGHSQNHIDLHAHGGEQALNEINGCMNDIRRELSATPEHFSFPYARWSKESRTMVVQAGWASAVADGGSFRISAGADQYGIARVRTPDSMTDLRFKTCAVFPQIFRLLGK